MGSSFRKAWHAPWTARTETLRLVLAPATWTWMRLHGVKVGRGCKLYGFPRIQRWRKSRIELGDGVSLRSWPSSNPLTPQGRVVLATRSRDAVIEIGSGSGLTGTVIVADSRVAIGKHVVVGANATVVDTDFHPLDYSERVSGGLSLGRGVSIEDGVFVGMNACILKGVHIGRQAIIGAGSVVTRDVPAGMIAAGNPARVVGPVSDAGCSREAS